jgi:hypothetical protein
VALPEQRDRVLLVVVRREDDDAGLRVLGPDPPGGLDALRRVRRGHPDVGQDRVRPVLLDRGQQLVEAGDARDEVDRLDRLQQGRCPFPDQVVILGEDHAHHRPDGTCGGRGRNAA